MVSKYLLDEKLKERENVVILNKIEDARQFVKYFVNLMEDILNNDYNELKSYFEEDKTVAEIGIIERCYKTVTGIENCYIIARVKLHKEDFSYPKLKVVEFKIAGKFSNYTMNIDNFIYGSVDDEEFINYHLQIIKSTIFEDFKYDWSCNKDKIFKRCINGINITPSQYIIECINKYFYKNIIKPKCKTMTYVKFLNSEFKFDIDKKTQKIFDNYFFKNIPNIKRRIITNV